MQEPAPVLRRVEDLEHQRATILREVDELRSRQREQCAASGITVDQVRALLRRLFSDVDGMAADSARRNDLRQTINEVIERIVLDPATLSARLHYSFRSGAAGDNLATPRGFEPLLQP